MSQERVADGGVLPRLAAHLRGKTTAKEVGHDKGWNSSRSSASHAHAVHHRAQPASPLIWRVARKTS
eukprot:1598810-Pyramimonas_sp.AAC.1